MLQQSYTKSTHLVSQITSGNVDESSSQQQNCLSGRFLSKFATWILDSGATDHVTHDSSFLVTFHAIKPIHVNLPNGITVTAKYFGYVQLSKNLWLYNVLYIPDFTFNIVSIP